MKIRKITLTFLLVLNLVLWTGCPEEEHTETALVFDTQCTIRLMDGSPGRIARAVFEEMQEIHNRLNAHSPDSALSRISANAESAVKVEQDVFDLISASIMLAAQTNRLFEPSIKPLADLWGFTSGNTRSPSPEAIEKALEFVDSSRIVLGPENNSVMVAQGQALDLGAIAKGYATDRAREMLLQAGVTRAILDFGGNLVFIGKKPGSEPWIVGIRNPEPGKAPWETVATVTVKEQAVVTSGLYERFFYEDEHLFHHIIDPRTGFPAENNLASVTIITFSGMTGDGLSTATFLMGLENGLSFINSQAEVEAIFITKNREIILSQGLRGRVEITDPAYSLL